MRALERRDAAFSPEAAEGTLLAPPHAAAEPPAVRLGPLLLAQSAAVAAGAGGLVAAMRAAGWAEPGLVPALAVPVAGGLVFAAAKRALLTPDASSITELPTNLAASLVAWSWLVLLAVLAIANGADPRLGGTGGTVATLAAAGLAAVAVDVGFAGLLRLVTGHRWGWRRSVVVTSGPDGDGLAERLAAAGGRRSIAGIARIRSGDEPALDQLVDAARRRRVDEVIVALGGGMADRAMHRVVQRFAATPVDVLLWPGPLASALGPLAEGEGAPGVPLLPLIRQPIRGPAGIAKRSLDILASLVALAILGLPLLLVALAIRLDSPGPAIFRQRRGGLGHTPIEVWKFRTMHTAPPGTVEFRQARRGDPRVTRIGRILRRTSIDELPQLVNVLRGDMSLVGPRPHPLALDERFAGVLPLYAARYRVRPGITGLAQVSGWRGETDTVEKMAARVEADLRYIRHWSLWFDLKILATTALGRFTHPNAY